MRLNRFNTQITIIKPKDNNDIIDILSKVFGFIDNKEEIKRKISRRLNNNLSIKIELNGKIVGCYLLAEKSINEFIRQINSNELKDFPKNETNIMISDKLSDNGIQGISLAVLPEYRDKGFGEKLKNYVDNLDYDYIWGVQDKKLENINFWTKTRKIIVESDTHFATLKVRNNMKYLKLFEELIR
jgi:ribosomal protein S18 acetylase RimI-like enzyme